MGPMGLPGMTGPPGPPGLQGGMGEPGLVGVMVRQPDVGQGHTPGFKAIYVE